MDVVEVRELRYFIALAEELHFGRAAERLHLAQPALSKAIRRLEAKLGVALLERTTRSVTLTAEGEALLMHGRTAVDAVDAAAQRARRAGRAAPVLTAKSTEGPLASELVERWARLEPELPAPEVLISGWGEQAAMLRDGRADAAILHAPFDPAGLRVEMLRSEPRVAALPASHRLARRKRVRLAELAGDPRPSWVGADRATAAFWTATDHGPSAPAGPPVSDLAQVLEVVALGQAVAFVPASAADRHRRSDLTYVPVSGLSPTVEVVAWPEHSTSERLRQLARAARELREAQELETRAAV
jgi:DNA-binding transcriptional LysR family regulator